MYKVFEFKSSEDLREFILNRQEHDDEPNGVSGPCYEISWKKDRWLIRLNNKRVAEITKNDVPVGFDLRSNDFVLNLPKVLRTQGPEGLGTFLESLK